MILPALIVGAAGAAVLVLALVMAISARHKYIDTRVRRRRLAWRTTLLGSALLVIGGGGAAAAFLLRR